MFAQIKGLLSGSRTAPAPSTEMLPPPTRPRSGGDSAPTPLPAEGKEVKVTNSVHRSGGSSSTPAPTDELSVAITSCIAAARKSPVNFDDLKLLEAKIQQLMLTKTEPLELFHMRALKTLGEVYRTCGLHRDIEMAYTLSIKIGWKKLSDAKGNEDTWKLATQCFEAAFTVNPMSIITYHWLAFINGDKIDKAQLYLGLANSCREEVEHRKEQLTKLIPSSGALPQRTSLQTQAVFLEKEINHKPMEASWLHTYSITRPAPQSPSSSSISRSASLSAPSHGSGASFVSSSSQRSLSSPTASSSADTGAEVASKSSPHRAFPL